MTNIFTQSEIAKVHSNLVSFFKMNFYAAGRTAEVLRGLFPATHILQFIAIDNTEKETELLNSNSHVFFIKKENGFGPAKNDRRLASFDFFNVLLDCVIYKSSSLSDAKKPEFLYRLEKESFAEPKTGIKFPSFEINLEFWSNNSFFHEETTFVMEAVKDYITSGIGKENDIPLIGEIHRYLASGPDFKKDCTYEALLKSFEKHDTGDKMKQVFFEILAEQNKGN